MAANGTAANGTAVNSTAVHGDAAHSGAAHNLATHSEAAHGEAAHSTAANGSNVIFESEPPSHGVNTTGESRRPFNHHVHKSRHIIFPHQRYVSLAVEKDYNPQPCKQKHLILFSGNWVLLIIGINSHLTARLSPC